MMKLQAMESYFKRNWKREDMMNVDEIPVDVHRSLRKVYLTLFGAMLSSTFGCFLHWILLAGGKFTVLSYVASLICLYFTPPGRVYTRILLSMLAANSFGASVGIFTNLFKIEQLYNNWLWNFLYGAMITRERSEIYLGCLKYCFVLMFSGFAFILLEGHTALWMIKTLFMGYLVVYSQEILYDANFGDINFVNCTFTVFFNLPAIVIHAARVYLQGAEFEQHGQN